MNKTMKYDEQTIKALMVQHGLKPDNREHNEAFLAEFRAQMAHASEAEKKQLTAGEMPPAATRAAERVARQFRVSPPGPMLKADNRTPQERYADTLPAAQRAEMLGRLNGTFDGSRQEAARQAELRQQYAAQLADYAVAPNGALRNNEVDRIKKKFTEYGLTDTSLPEGFGVPAMPADLQGLTPEQQSQTLIARSKGEAAPTSWYQKFNASRGQAQQ